jgi:hypothetical protein
MAERPVSIQQRGFSASSRLRQLLDVDTEVVDLGLFPDHLVLDVALGWCQAVRHHGVEVLVAFLEDYFSQQGKRDLAAAPAPDRNDEADVVCLFDVFEVPGKTLVELSVPPSFCRS